ncbi:MAG: nuclear transport factor 2 family protein [Pseudomonadales bacterium]|nr:nuclear transport factor 2 family protein [Pseudomonadales bacterium]
MKNNIDTIKDFVTAWSRLDAKELVEYFTEDGIYHNMPIGPVAGKDKLLEFITVFLKDWAKTEWELINISESGNVVFTERVDRTQIGKKLVELPCCGIFEMQDGKISAWRDYFDMATYTRALE